MLGKLTNLILSIIDEIIPVRSDFQIVKNLKEEDIYNLTKSDRVENEEWITPLFKYKDRKVKAIIWELKYKENTLPLPVIGKMIFDEIIAVVSDILIFDTNAEFLLIPIPLTNTSKIERGFNQSELICKSIIESDSERKLIYAPQLFTKIKETPKQSLSDSKENRINNLTDSFNADERVEDKYIFLIDDVTTTGSTLREARKTLLEKGVKDVFAFTIAH